MIVARRKLIKLKFHEYKKKALKSGFSRSFDTTDILRPSESGENNAEALFSDLYVHLLLYGESGRVVDLGRAEGAFRILR